MDGDTPRVVDCLLLIFFLFRRRRERWEKTKRAQNLLHGECLSEMAPGGEGNLLFHLVDGQNWVGCIDFREKEHSRPCCLSRLLSCTTILRLDGLIITQTLPLYQQHNYLTATLLLTFLSLSNFPFLKLSNDHPHTQTNPANNTHVSPTCVNRPFPDNRCRPAAVRFSRNVSSAGPVVRPNVD